MFKEPNPNILLNAKNQIEDRLRRCQQISHRQVNDSVLSLLICILTSFVRCRLKSWNKRLIFWSQRSKHNANYESFKDCWNRCSKPVGFVHLIPWMCVINVALNISGICWDISQGNWKCKISWKCNICFNISLNKQNDQQNEQQTDYSCSLL